VPPSKNLIGFMDINRVNLIRVRVYRLTCVFIEWEELPSMQILGEGTEDTQ
jgi:hypothetical protein